MKDWKELSLGEKIVLSVIVAIGAITITSLFQVWIVLSDNVDFDDSYIKAKFDKNLFEGVEIIYTDKPMTDLKRFLFYGERNTNLAYYLIYFRTIKVYINQELESSLCHELWHHYWYTKMNETEKQLWQDIYNEREWKDIDDRVDSVAELFAYSKQDNCENVTTLS